MATRFVTPESTEFNKFCMKSIVQFVFVCEGLFCEKYCCHDFRVFSPPSSEIDPKMEKTPDEKGNFWIT